MTIVKRNGKFFYDRGLGGQLTSDKIRTAKEMVIQDPKTKLITKTVKPNPVDFGLDHEDFRGDNNKTLFYSRPEFRYGVTLVRDGIINWDTTTGEDGYGLRDYSGRIQFKDSGGSWSDIDGKADDEGSYILTSADADLANSRVLDDDGDYLSLTDDGSKITVGWAKTNNISIWTNDSDYVTPSSTNTLTNKDGDISQWNNDSGYTANVGTVTPSSSDAFTNKTGNNSMWTNDAGYGSGDGTVTSVSNGDSTISVGGTSAAPTIVVVEANFSGIPNTALTNDGITIGGADTDLGGSVSGDTIIGDVSAGEIGNSLLDNDSLTVTAGTGLSGGGEVSLGGSITLNNTEVASAIGGQSVWTSSSVSTILLGTATDAVFNFTTNAAANTDVVSGNSSGVYTVVGAGVYRVMTFVTLKADTTARSGTGLVIRFTDKAITPNTDWRTTFRECPTSGATFEITMATYTFTQDSATTIEVLVVSDNKSGEGTPSNYDLIGETETSPMSNVAHTLVITRVG